MLTPLKYFFVLLVVALVVLLEQEVLEGVAVELPQLVVVLVVVQLLVKEVIHLLVE